MKKRYSAIILSLVMAAALAGCGDSSDSSSKSKSSESREAESSISVNSVDTGSEQIVSSDIETNEGDTNESEAEQPTEDKRTAFYKLLDEEYQKYGKGSWTNGIEESAQYDDIRVLDNGYGFVCNRSEYAYLFDESGKCIDVLDKLKGLYDPDGTHSFMYYYFGGEYLYIRFKPLSNADYETLVQMDMEGNIVSKVNIERHPEGYGKNEKNEWRRLLCGASNDGTAIVRIEHHWSEIENRVSVSHEETLCYFMRKGSNTLEKLPGITVEVHGITEEKTDFENYEFLSSIAYNNRVYARYDDKCYYLDCDDLSWHEIPLICNTAAYTNVGRYLFMNNRLGGESWTKGSVYDLETDTYLDEELSIVYNYLQVYRGGDSVIYGWNDRLEELRLPTDGQIDCETVKTFDHSIYEDADAGQSDHYNFMSKEHYIVVDDYGIFIHSFENGADDEITVAMFDK